MPVESPLQFIGPRPPKPEWLKVRAPGSENYVRLKGIMKELKLNTVCEDAHCPNIGECWHHGTATFMILGDVCTRSCAYCAVAHGKPSELDVAEPGRVAEAIARMRLQYAVITSVDRDDQADGGAGIFAETIRLTRERVYAANQLFATLDTTLRRLHVPGAEPIVLSDTVGFIRDLPHDLVAAFRATLAEAGDADLIVHVVDSAAADRDAQVEAVEGVLDEIGVSEVPRLKALNKIDAAGLAPGVERDAHGTIASVRLSALTGAGCADFLAALAERFPAGAVHADAAATAPS